MKLLATYCVYCGRTKSSEWTPMPVALRATTIVAAPPDCGILRAAAHLNDWQPKRLVRLFPDEAKL